MSEAAAGHRRRATQQNLSKVNGVTESQAFQRLPEELAEEVNRLLQGLQLQRVQCVEDLLPGFK